MATEKTSFFRTMAYVAYGYYSLIALLYLIPWNGIIRLNVIAVSLSVLTFFCVQMFIMKRLLNLIAGLLLLAMSIFMTLDFVSAGLQFAFSASVKVMLSMSVTSIILSGFLIFSYIKLPGKERN